MSSPPSAGRDLEVERELEKAKELDVTIDDDELRSLHGMGPKAIDQLQAALQARGMPFAVQPPA